MKYVHVLAALAVLAADAPSVWAETIAARGARDSRVRIAAYDAEQVYRLPGFVGYQVHLQFEAGERFVGLGAGDIEGLEFAAEGNNLFLKPKAAKVATNLTVLTSLRHYHFEYWALARRPDPVLEDVIYSLRFTYPPPPKQAVQRAAVDTALDADAKPAMRNFEYAYCGHPALKPIAAFDDGVHTHLRFAPRAELPAIFLRNADGSESLVNATVEADSVRVHRVAERLIVRRGRLAGCIVNRAFVGTGTKLDTGTVSPEVRRRTKEVIR